MGKYKLELIKEGRIASIMIPFNAKSVYNKPKGTINVQGLINDIPYRIKLTSKGNDKQIMIINKDLQKKIGFCEGKLIVDITIEEDSIESIITEPLNLIMDSNINILNGIVSRRSIRSYTNKKVSEEQINTILNAGFCAPSAKNKRPWHFIVIKNRKKLNRISQINTNTSMINNSNCCIVVCGDKIMQGINELLVEDCSAATQNMLLASHGLGLGAVWCGIIKNSDTHKILKEVLKLPETILPISLVSLGYPDEIKLETPRFDKAKVHKETWGNM